MLDVLLSTEFARCTHYKSICSSISQLEWNILHLWQSNPNPRLRFLHILYYIIFMTEWNKSSIFAFSINKKCTLRRRMKDFVNLREQSAINSWGKRSIHVWQNISYNLCFCTILPVRSSACYFISCFVGTWKGAICFLSTSVATKTECQYPKIYTCIYEQCL